LGFRSLQHIRDRRSTSRGLCLPATFRLQGLATLLTAYSLRTPAGFVSRRRRSWDSPLRSLLLPRGFPRVSTWENPPTVCRCQYSHRVSGGPAQQGPVSGLRPSRESLTPSEGVNPLDAGCSLGVRPPRVPQHRPWPGFRPASSHALRKLQQLPAAAAGAPEYQSADTPPHLRRRDNPCRVCAPTRSRSFECQPPGL
jgi:hypothetical protein